MEILIEIHIKTLIECRSTEMIILCNGHQLSTKIKNIIEGNVNSPFKQR